MGFLFLLLSADKYAGKQGIRVFLPHAGTGGLGLALMAGFAHTYYSYYYYPDTLRRCLAREYIHGCFPDERSYKPDGCLNENETAFFPLITGFVCSSLL
jgi:hypothetical protein